jgi:DNA ligase-1
MLSELPAVFMAFDLLEYNGRDMRGVAQHQRRALLENAVTGIDSQSLILTPLIHASDWEELHALREGSRAQAVEGLMLKEINAQYGMGRTKEQGIWWKWKVDPYSVDAVLVYAQPGHGRRASLFTDYTFAVWDKDPSAPDRQLVPFAKAYSGLTDREIARVDAIIRKTTVERFGPVRSVTPAMVFEIGFEAIAPSARHKAGVAVRFPRMLRIRDDKKVSEADTLDTLTAMLGGARS